MEQLNDLNPAQSEAVQCTNGPLLVLAGAGSGKTRVITYRIARLIDTIGISPWNILAVTFTNKAAGEMRERLERLLGVDSNSIWVGTFHSVCARMLRIEAKAFDLDSSFTIYDEDDRRTLVRRILSDMNIDEQNLTPRTAIGQISRAKNAMIDATTFRQQTGQTAAPQRRIVADLFERYESEMLDNHAFDFDDLICEPVRRFQLHKDILEKYRNRFRHILIDEYQDTNRPQYLLSKLLAQEHRNICCVGDDDQSIYHFRGADIRNILDFERDYPDATVIRLEQNYRSTGRILAAANAIISNNRGRKGKNLWTEASDGDPLCISDCGDDRAEARHIVTSIIKLCQSRGMALNECAVLYRTNAQSRVLEEELQKGGIPYVIVGSIRFYERKEIKDLLAYLRLLVNPADDVSFLRIVNMPKRGVGATTTKRLREFAAQQQLGLLDAVMMESIPGLNARAANSLRQFADILRALREGLATLDLPELAALVLDRTGYMEFLRADPSPEARAREENVGQLIARIAEFAKNSDSQPANTISSSDPYESMTSSTVEFPRNPGADFKSEFSEHDSATELDRFLEEVALMSPVDEAGLEVDSVTLMTLHMAKGLEFPFVMITGLEENLFPTARAVEESHTGDSAAIEEERRLFYVGVTRAQKFLAITFARWRYFFGSLQEAVPSRFLEEIPLALVEIEEISQREGLGFVAAERRADSERRMAARRSKHRSSPTPQKTAHNGIHYDFDDDQSSMHADTDFSVGEEDDLLAIGRWVLHPTLGRGKIVDREGNGVDLKVSIRFASSTRPKKIMVAYAQLEPA